MTPCNLESKIDTNDTEAPVAATVCVLRKHVLKISKIHKNFGRGFSREEQISET